MSKTVTLRYNNAVFTGEVDKSGRVKVNGTCEWVSGQFRGQIYTGDFRNDKRHGTGKFKWVNGDEYEGQFVDGLRCGTGRLTWANGESYSGEWSNDKRNGRGVFTWPDGQTYEGDFASNMRTGKGFTRYPDGSTYTGDYVYNMRDGWGSLVRADGTSYEGEWKEDYPLGMLPPPAEESDLAAAAGETAAGGEGAERAPSPVPDAAFESATPEAFTVSDTANESSTMPADSSEEATDLLPPEEDGAVGQGRGAERAGEHEAAPKIAKSASVEIMVTSFYPLSELQAPGPYPEDVSIEHREKYLSEEEFARVMGVDKAAFRELPKWRQMELKKKKKLF